VGSKRKTGLHGQAKGQGQEPELDLSSENCRILYVDDDPDARQAFRRLLARKGFQIETVSSGIEAIALTRTKSYAVIATDLEMPEMTGIQLIETLHRSTPSTSFVLVTGAAWLDLPTETEGARAITCVIHKPWEVEEVDDALRRGIRLHHTRTEIRSPSRRNQENTTHVLLLEDNPGDARLVQRMLSGSRASNYEVCHVERLEDGLRKLEQAEFQIILTDLSLPDARGMDGVTKLQTSCPWVPIVVMSGVGDEELAVGAVQAGAQDYLVKGTVDGASLHRALRYAIERKAAQQRLAYLAQYDQLTGLANRTTFQEHARRAVARARREPGRRPAIFVLDLDRFKSVNDTLGHDVGDKLLSIVADRLLSAIAPPDLVARLGGDEFAVLIENISNEEMIAGPAIRIMEAMRPDAIIGEHALRASTSIGIASYPDNGLTVEDLTVNADVAMYRAKKEGRNSYQFFDQAMHDKALGRLELERDLEGACARGEFVLYFQPLQHQRKRALACEALLRWQHPTKGLVEPGAFIPLLEDSGEIVEVGAWVLKQACEQVSEWQTRLGFSPRIAVNVSPRQFEDPNLVTLVTNALRNANIDPSCLELEVTESIVMRDPESAAVALKKLSDLGVRIAIDDFGTGFTQFACLVRFPITTLKIDRSVTETIGETDGNTIARTLIDMGHNLGLEIVAEGVETEIQREFLRSHSCDTIQGYLIARPMPGPECEAWMLQVSPELVAAS
tara:strand:- start:63272 stop:65464 length:2193 start_codon:yes stop_codon:yes gene_type:complete